MLLPTVAAVLGLVSTAAAAPSPNILAADDVIVLKHDGTSEVMKAAEFDRLESRAAAPSVFGVDDTEATTLARRGCEESTEIQVLSDETFLNWDVAISPVVSSQGGSGTVSVSAGYSISNSVSVGISQSLTVVKDLLSQSFSFTYTDTWTTTTTQTQSFAVPDGQYGVIVSQPYVRRVQGNVLSGCTDSPDNSTFSSDTYTSQSYGDLEWVKGVIRLCNSTEYPIPYCIGTGTHA